MMEKMYASLTWDYEMDNLQIFSEKLREARKTLESNKKIFMKPRILHTLDTLKNGMENGRFTCIIEGVVFECLLQKKNSKRLYVMFNGAIGERSEEKKIPNFQRWSWAPLVDATVLNIFDPMYLKYKNLKIGWYYGTKDQDYRELLGRLIRTVADALSIRCEDVVLYGSSAGGTAAVFTAHYVPECTVVAINPQLRLYKHEWYDHFVEITGIDTKEKDARHRNDVFFHIDHTPDTRFLIMTNINSRVDFNYQLIPVAQHYGFNIHYGLLKNKNLYSWVFDNKENHRGIDYPSIFVAIDHFVADILPNRTIEECAGYVRFINEFWKDHYDLIYENKELKKQIEVLKQGS